MEVFRFARLLAVVIITWNAMILSAAEDPSQQRPPGSPSVRLDAEYYHAVLSDDAEGAIAALQRGADPAAAALHRAVIIGTVYLAGGSPFRDPRLMAVAKNLAVLLAWFVTNSVTIPSQYARAASPQGPVVLSHLQGDDAPKARRRLEFEDTDE